MLRRFREEDRAKLLGSVGLNSLGDLYSVFPPKAREFSENVFSRLKDLLNKSPHSAFLKALLLEEEVSPSGAILWDSLFGRYLAKEFDRLHYEFPDELLTSPALIDLAFDFQSFLCDRLQAQTASCSFSSGFSAMMEAVRLCLNATKLPNPSLVVAESIPLAWRQSLALNLPDLTLITAPLKSDGTLGWKEIPTETLLAVAAVITSRELRQSDQPLVRELMPQAGLIDVVFDPLSLYPKQPMANGGADFIVVELQEVLCTQRQVTGLSAGVLAGKREAFAKAQTWLVGKNKITKQKQWFQPATGSTAPLPRFLPLESLKAYLAWQVHDSEVVDAVATRARAQFVLLRTELEKMGVPCLFGFEEGRQGLFRVPHLEARCQKAKQTGWLELIPAEKVWGNPQGCDLTAALWVRVGNVSDSQIKSLIEALTHD